MQSAIASVKRSLNECGFDLVHAFRLPPQASLDLHSDLQGNRLALLVGNTRHLWPIFKSHLREHPDWLQIHSQHPLDAYVEFQLHRILEAVAEFVVKPQIYFSHRRYSNQFIPFQRLAACAGTVTLHPTSYLCIHPVHGPWFALRALVVLGNHGEQEFRDFKVDTAVDRVRLEDILEGRIQTAMHQLKTGSVSWMDWVALRDLVAEAVPSSKAWRYTDNQMRYHYTKDIHLLKQD